MPSDNIVSLNVAKVQLKGKEVLTQQINMLNGTGELLCEVVRSALIEFQEKVDDKLHWRLHCKMVADLDHFAQRHTIFSSLVQYQWGDAEAAVPYAWIRFDEVQGEGTPNVDRFTKPYEILIAIPCEYWPEMDMSLLFAVIGGANRLYVEGFRVLSWESSVPDKPESKTLITLIRDKQLAVIEVDFNALLADNRLLTT